MSVGDVTLSGCSLVTGPGTTYTRGARSTTCALAFSLASSGLGAAATPVTVAARWAWTWAANGVNTTCK
jgi:hypothetical protein